MILTYGTYSIGKYIYFSMLHLLIFPYLKVTIYYNFFLIGLTFGLSVR